MGLKYNWNKLTLDELFSFYDTSVEKGITENSIKARKAKFGYNNLNLVSKNLQSVFTYNAVRSGKHQKVSANKLVVGDIIQLSAGQVAPAYLRLVQVNKLVADEHKYSGIPGKAYKNAHISAKSQANNILPPGAVIVSGKAKAMVVDYDNNKPSSIRPSEARFLLRKNKFIQNSKIPTMLLKSIDVVVFDDLRREYEVIKSAQKLFIEKGISCVYILEPSIYKKMLTSFPLANNLTSHINSPINGIYFVKASNQAGHIVRCIAALKAQHHNVLYVYRGEEYQEASRVSDLNLVVLPRSKQEAVFKAQIVTRDLNINQLNCVLHNKK